MKYRVADIVEKLARRAARTMRPAARASLSREMFFGLSSEFTPIVCSDRAGLKYLVSTQDETVGRHAFLTGGFDLAEMTDAMQQMRSLGIGGFQSKTFVDIGANIGTSLLPAVTQFGFARGIGFEPEAANFALLSCNVLLNHLSDRIIVQNLAISDSAGEMKFETCPQNSGDGRVRVDAARGAPELLRESLREEVRVQAITFDEVLERGTVRLDDIGLVWMDTQGHEGHVLRGASKLTRSSIPVLMEYCPYLLKRAGGLEMLEEVVREHYSTIALIRGSGGTTPRLLKAADICSLREMFTGTNFTDILLLH
ncbi:hypothetical protein BH09PLA1_BH09PLA1_24750 [soil metagenome]